MSRPGKTRISYKIIDKPFDPESNTGLLSNNISHHNGINTLALEVESFNQGRGGVLFSGGRDSNINVWSLNLDHTCLQSKMNPNSNQGGSELSDTFPSKLYPQSSKFGLTAAKGFSSTGSIPSTIPTALKQKPHDKHATEKGSGDVSSNTGTSRAQNVNISFEKVTQYNLSILHAPTKGTTLDSTLCWHSDWVNHLIILNQGKNLISCSADRSILLWDLNASKNPSRIGLHGDYVKKIVKPKSDCNWVCSGGLDRSIKFWDLAETRHHPTSSISVSDLPSGSVYSLASCKNGSVIASGSADKIVRLWDYRSGKAIHEIRAHSDIVRDLLVSSDGKWVNLVTEHRCFLPQVIPQSNFGLWPCPTDR